MYVLKVSEKTAMYVLKHPVHAFILFENKTNDTHEILTINEKNKLGDAFCSRHNNVLTTRLQSFQVGVNEQVSIPANVNRNIRRKYWALKDIL